MSSTITTTPATYAHAHCTYTQTHICMQEYVRDIYVYECTMPPMKLF